MVVLLTIDTKESPSYLRMNNVKTIPKTFGNNALAQAPQDRLSLPAAKNTL